MTQHFNVKKFFKYKYVDMLQLCLCMNSAVNNGIAIKSQKYYTNVVIVLTHSMFKNYVFLLLLCGFKRWLSGMLVL